MAAFTDAQLAILQTEKDTDPLVRGYGAMSNAQLATSLSTADRDAPANPSAIFEYMMVNEFRNGAIYGRVSLVAAILPDPTTASMGNAPMGASGAAVAQDHRSVAAARALIRLSDDERGSLSVPLTETTISNLLGDLDTTRAECMSVAQKDAIIALSQNKQTRAAEIGLPSIVPETQVARLV